MDEQEETIIGSVSSNDVELFLSEVTERSTTECVGATVLYTRWAAWHEQKAEDGQRTGERWFGFAGSQVTFGRLLAHLGLRKFRKRGGVVYAGLRIKDGGK